MAQQHLAPCTVPREILFIFRWKTNKQADCQCFKVKDDSFGVHKGSDWEGTWLMFTTVTGTSYASRSGEWLDKWVVPTLIGFDWTEKWLSKERELVPAMSTPGADSMELVALNVHCPNPIAVRTHSFGLFDYTSHLIRLQPCRWIDCHNWLRLDGSNWLHSSVERVPDLIHLFTCGQPNKSRTARESCPDCDEWATEARPYKTAWTKRFVRTIYYAYDCIESREASTRWSCIHSLGSWARFNYPAHSQFQHNN